jgi:hypothetical protein
VADDAIDLELDADLRQMARASLAHDAAAVDADADLGDLRARFDRGASATAPARRSGMGRWSMVAAATALAVGAVVAIFWTQSADDAIVITSLPPTSLVAPQTVKTAPVTTTLDVAPSAPATSATTVPEALASAGAVAEPTVVLTGGEVTITPAEIVERACDLRVRTVRRDGAAIGEVGVISPGSWAAGGSVEVGESCAGSDTVSDEPLTVAVPRNMPAGIYDLCLTADLAAPGCARVTVARPAGEATAAPATVTVGDLVTITPAGVVERACQDVVTVIPLGNAAGFSGQIVSGQWVAGAVTEVTYPDCAGEVSDAPVQVVIPVDMPTDVFAMCVVEQPSYAVQGTAVPGCAVVTVLPAPLPVCWTEPVAPPTLIDGAPPGAAVVDAYGLATWGVPGAPTSVTQSLGSAPRSEWLDDPFDGVRQVSSGAVRAAVVVAGDWEGGPKIILVRGTDGCDREYGVGQIPIDDAVALAQTWVDALAAAAPAS